MGICLTAMFLAGLCNIVSCDDLMVLVSCGFCFDLVFSGGFWVVVWVVVWVVCSWLDGGFLVFAWLGVTFVGLV